MANAFEELKKLIDCVQSVYTSTTDEWLNKTNTKINLKRSLVADIDTNGVIYKSITDYVQFLNEKNATIYLHFSSICSYQIAVRVKAQNSIEFKINNYKTKNHEFGKIPINKCFNDLFGIRIFLETPLIFEEISDFIREVYQDKYKCIDSSKYDYKAVHIYFKKDNNSFPWELQIWNKCDAGNNFASHKKYKQEYTTWEKEIKEGGVIND